MALSQEHAVKIAALLNARNQLTVKYTAAKVLDRADEYLLELSEAGDPVACVQLKRVQWYQAEVLHLTVAEAELRKGNAKKLLSAAEARARAQGVRLLQCTIRHGNIESENLFLGVGFSKVNAFHNEQSGNSVDVYQKVLTHPR